MRVSDLFSINYGVNLVLSELSICKKTDPNSINFISRTDYNNGISAFVQKIEGIDPNPANTLSVALGGSSVLATFYQPEPYYSGRDVAVLTPKKEMTPLVMIFYALCIKSNRYRYNFGRQANKTLKDICIPLKIPEQFLKNISLEKFATVERKSVIKKSIKLDTSKWKWFSYNELFLLKKGKRIIKEKMIEGKLPFIAAIDGNNGVRQYIEKEPLHTGNTITVNYNGSVAEAFYQEIPYWASDDVNVLYPKFKLNKYIALFLTTLIRKEQYRFNYGRKWYLDRMKDSKIKLPVTSNGNPDWQFMEDYIKSIQFSSSLC